MSHSRPIPAEAQSHLKQGQECCFSEPPDYVEAERLLGQAIVLAPHWGEPFHFLGYALQQQGKLTQAVDAIQSAVNLLPGDPRPLISLGQLMLITANYTKAVPLLEQGLNLKPHYAEADARLMLAEAYEGLGQIDKAAIEWRQIMTIGNDYPSYDLPMIEAKKKLAEYGLLSGSTGSE